jgi:Bacillus/Clostridium GerA spore germination protein.
LLAEVKRRIQSVTADYIGESGMLEQFIEDNHFILVPQTVSTERPDRVIAGLMEGQVALLIDGNPYALLVPATFFNVFQNPEDAYVRWPFGGFLRYIRLFGPFSGHLFARPLHCRGDPPPRNDPHGPAPGHFGQPGKRALPVHYRGADHGNLF